MRDAIYLAGLVDGDGSIFISKRYKENSAKNHGRYRLFLSVTNNNKVLLNYLYRTWKQGIVYWDSKNYKAGHITWEGPKAQTVIRKILPFLVGKRNQAKLALKYVFVGRGQKANTKAQATSFTQMRRLNQRWSMGKTRKDALRAI